MSFLQLMADAVLYEHIDTDLWVQSEYPASVDQMRSLHTFGEDESATNTYNLNWIYC